jgi:Ulp1 family protease
MSAQQTNGYDCGIYLICYAEHLAQHLVTYQTVDYFYSDDDVRNSVGTMRNEIVNVIERLRG